MRTTKIISGLLILAGFGSCCNRPAKSKGVNTQTGDTVTTDTIKPIRLMYGPPVRRFEPEKVREYEGAQDGQGANDTDSGKTSTDR